MIAISFLVVSAMLTLYLALYASVKIKKSGSRTYALLMICISIYSLGVALELSAIDIERIFLGIKIKYIGIVFTPALWIIFALKYTGIENKKIRSHYPLLFIIPVITLVLIYTNNLHHLYYETMGIISTPHLMVGKTERGIWYYVFLIFNNIIIIAGDLLFFRLMIRSRGYIRKQALIIVIASVFPWIGDILYLMGLSLYGIDHTPFFLTVMGPLLLLSMFRYRMLNLTPIARSIVFNEINDPIFVLDNEKRLVDQNIAAHNFLEKYQLCSESVHKDALPGMDQIRELINISSGNGLKFICRESDEIKYYNSHITLISSGSRNHLGKILTLHDITREQEMIDQLHSQATTDDLTGINNRRNLMKLCKNELIKSKRYNRPISLLLMDIDFFKGVNDTYGHQMGDKALQVVAQTLSLELRNPDIQGRYGGEEFIAILPETDYRSTEKIAERLRKSIEEIRIPFKEKFICINISIGTITVDSKNNNQTMESILTKVDEALYTAKETGRNKVVAYNSLKLAT